MEQHWHYQSLFVCCREFWMPKLLLAHWRNSILNFYHWYHHLICSSCDIFPVRNFVICQQERDSIFSWKQIIAFHSIRNGWNCEHLTAWLLKNRQSHKILATKMMIDQLSVRMVTWENLIALGSRAGINPINSHFVRICCAIYKFTSVPHRIIRTEPFRRQ